MKNNLRFPVEIKKIDSDGAEVEVIVNSGDIDRHGDKLVIDGVDFKSYLKNPVVQWAHDYSTPPIGKATKVWVEGKKLMAKVKFAVDEYDFAKQIYDLVKAGFINAVSIGFIALETESLDKDEDSWWGPVKFLKSEMVEFSFVPIPADPKALVTSKKLGIDSDLTKSYNEIVMKYELAKILAKDIDDLTMGEIKFLNDNIDGMTKKQIQKFASVLKQEDSEETPSKEEEPTTDEDEKSDDDKDLDKDDEEKDDEEELKDEVKKLRAEVNRLKKVEPVVIKNISGQSTSINKGTDKEVSKEVKFLHYIKGLQSGNFQKYLEIQGKDAMGTTGSNVLPPAEFIVDLERMEEEVGVAMRDANVRRSSVGNGLTYVLGDDDLEIFDTEEAGFKKSTKLSYQQLLLQWRKFAGILPITDELTEDSAIDLWNDAMSRFSRAYAKKADQLVFTNQASGGKTKNGIIHSSGVNVVTVDDINDLVDPDSDSWTKLVDMIYGVPSISGNTGKFYLNRETLGLVMKMKDGEGRPIWLSAVSDGKPATILNRPYEETEVLPGITETGAGVAHIVYGNLRYVTLGIRTDLQMKLFDSGIVGDPDEEDQEANTLNLLTQDMQALRAVRRMNAVVRFPAAFSVLKVASGS